MNQRRKIDSERVRRFLPRVALCWWVGVALTPACEAVHTSQDDGNTLTQSDAGAGSSPDAANPTSEASSNWCEVRAVIELKCQPCHGETPAHGAPFALVSYDDTQVLDRHGVPRYSAMASAVESDTMPPTYLHLDPAPAALSKREKQLLLDWASVGAPGPGDSDCAP